MTDKLQLQKEEYTGEKADSQKCGSVFVYIKIITVQIW